MRLVYYDKSDYNLNISLPDLRGGDNKIIKPITTQYYIVITSIL